MYTPETVQAVARAMQTDDAPHYAADAAHMLEDYAATLKAAQGGVTEAMVTHQAAAEALDSLDDYARMGTGVDAHGPRGMLERYIAQQAALSAPDPAAQGEVLIEAVGRVERDMTGELDINWLVEDGIHAIGEGSILLCADRDNVTDDYGRATLYTAPPPQPAERVPEVSWLADQLCDLRNKWAEGCEANWLETDDNHPDDWMAKELRKRWIAASPAPSPARVDGGEG